MCLYELHLLMPFLTIPPDHTSVVRRIAGKRLFGDYRRRAIQNLLADFELLGSSGS